MGGCLSSKSSSDDSSSGGHRKPSANVISTNGELRQFSLPITVAQVLLLQSPNSSSLFFLCNSDRLNFEEYIPSLLLHEQLQQDQIYFVLHTNKLQYRLAASDMAALAVKASIALEKINSSRTNRKVVRVTTTTAEYNNKAARNSSSSTISTTLGLGSNLRSSGSVRKIARYSSRRAKLAVRSFRIKLNTIYEGSVLHFN